MIPKLTAPIFFFLKKSATVFSPNHDGFIMVFLFGSSNKNGGDLLLFLKWLLWAWRHLCSNLWRGHWFYVWITLLWMLLSPETTGFLLLFSFWYSNKNGGDLLFFEKKTAESSSQFPRTIFIFFFFLQMKSLFFYNNIP